MTKQFPKGIDIDRQVFADIVALALTQYKRQHGLNMQKATPAQRYAEMERDNADVAAVMESIEKGPEGRGTLARGINFTGTEKDSYTEHCDQVLPNCKGLSNLMVGLIKDAARGK